VSGRSSSLLWLALALAASAGCATRGDVDYLSDEHQQITQRQT
jgi:hypothetical protein